MQAPVDSKTCFGCGHADICYLCPVTNEYRVPVPNGFFTCRGYDAWIPKPLTKEDAVCGPVE